MSFLKNLEHQLKTIWLHTIRELIKNKKKYLTYYYFMLPVFAVICIYALMFSATVNSFNLRKQTIIVNPNASASSILWQLQSKGLVRNWYNAKLALLLSESDKKIHAGRYEISPAMSLQTIFAVLSEKKGLSENSSKRVVIPEGFSMIEIIERLEEDNVVSKNVFQQYMKTIDKTAWQEKYPFLKNDNIDNMHFFEGYLFPDTYIFAENTSPESILNYMLYNFQANVLPLIKKARSSEYNLHQLVTLASIVEKEAGVSEERDVIAGIFYNRLKKRMYLGSCPTVKYALGRPRKKYLLYKELDVVSPYNTYRHIGLPPGPICSPGLASYRAILAPAKTDYLYFVAKGDGTHVFSSSLAEHLKNQREIADGKIY